ncbi:small RNA degrading nuclease 1 [Selaginella moellendorffii]|uniref:small RNA degrading nuclease 1 n=1 Tax=Selaginella moellendorffii TaxID=88036 RepID=UPI000D1D0FBE|nr:small RNA degrading nuclease 1 [Selaginella moellendorffii]|eukprot:XP_024530721.1 small RNA degrading nuclease 1 [Selaginella moellendorffii]
MEVWPSSPEQLLVERTREHPRFLERYKSFQSYATKRREAEGWYYATCTPGSEVKLLALDCEMVECIGNEEQIVQLCVADRDCKKLVDILVKPSRPIVDYRTPVHGITAQDLNRAAYCTQKDAQDKLVELLTPGTILVGHTLSHDLEILKISYPRVIDVGLLFKTNREATVGLNDLCKIILGFDMRGEDGRHDCFQDTVAAMKLALHELVRPTLGALDLAAINENKLLIHGIPASITADNLSNLFAIKCTVKVVA